MLNKVYYSANLRQSSSYPKHCSHNFFIFYLELDAKFYYSSYLALMRIPSTVLDRIAIGADLQHDQMVCS